MNSFILFAVLSVFCGGSDSVVVDCKFRTGNYEGKNYYLCDVQNSELITTREDREISGVRGSHLSGKSNDDVDLFFSYKKKVLFFPHGLTKFFKNIVTILIYSKELKEITKEDLKEFGEKLKNLWLAYSSIEVIEADLFEFNPNLEYFELIDNKLRHIESGAFDKLTKFKKFTLYSNVPCQYVNSIKETEEQCKDPNYVPRITTTTTTTQNPMNELQAEISSLTLNLTSTLDILKAKEEKIAKLKEEKDKNAKENESKISQLEATVLALEEENRKLKTKSDQEMKAFEQILSKLSVLDQIQAQTSKIEDIKNQMKQVEDVCNPERTSEF